MEGQCRQTQFSVADVNKVLMSAAQVANRGHRIVLQPYYMESYIEDIATGDRMALHQQDGVYVQRLTHVQADADGGFRGQAPDYVPGVFVTERILAVSPVEPSAEEVVEAPRAGGDGDAAGYESEGYDASTPRDDAVPEPGLFELWR